MKRFFAGVWTLILWLGALGLLAYALLAAFPVNHRFADVGLQFAKPILVAGVAALFLLAWMRRNGPVVITLAACATLLAVLLPYSLPPRPAAPDDVRLYFSNTWVRNQHPDRLAASIEDADADIVVLIELGAATSPRLDSMLAYLPHRVSTPSINALRGTTRSVIASRWPVRAIQEDVADGIHVVAAIVETPQGPLRVLGVHLTRPWPFSPSTAQTWQLERLFTRLGSDPVRTVVAGDFNSAPPSRALNHTLRYSGLRLVSGAQGSWPSAAPGPLRMAIDHVLASPDIAPVAARRGAPTGSDHSPVVVDLRLGPPEPGLAARVSEN